MKLLKFCNFNKMNLNAMRSPLAHSKHPSILWIDSSKFLLQALGLL